MNAREIDTLRRRADELAYIASRCTDLEAASALQGHAKMLSQTCDNMDLSAHPPSKAHLVCPECSHVIRVKILVMA